MKVDYQSHWYPAAHLQLLASRDRFPRAETLGDGKVVYEGAPGDRWELREHYFSLDAFLADMEESGIDRSVVSPNLFAGVESEDRAWAAEVAESVNELVAAAQAANRERIVGLAIAPMDDTDAALRVLERALVELDLWGVCVLSNTRKGPIATEATLPIFERIAELGRPLFLHPSHKSICSDRLDDPITEIGVAWMGDTAAAAMSLITSGALNRCPQLRVVHPHLGGALPYLLGRVEENYAEFRPQAEMSVRDYIERHFWVDSVNSTPGAFELAQAIYGGDRILLGTDYPWLSRRQGLDFVAADYPDALAAAVLTSNQIPGLLSA
jgi:aminocarboxymuconate-semialdehyde decarboxylase